MQHIATQTTTEGEGFVPLDLFTQENHISPVTAWRWRKRGWLRTVNLAGRQYIERDEIRRFLERARAGEFAKDAVTPKRNGKEVTK